MQFYEIKKISALHRLYFIQFHIPNISCHLFIVHLTDQPNILFHLRNIRFTFFLTKLIVHHHHLIIVYHHPVRTLGQPFAIQDINFVQYPGRTVVPTGNQLLVE